MSTCTRVHARDLARDWSAGQPVSLDDLNVEGRSVAVESAALSFIVPWDPLTVGRTMQALFNALCIPDDLRAGPRDRDDARRRQSSRRCC